MTDPNTEMRTYEVGFSIDHGLRHLKCKEKITDSHRNTFKKEANNFSLTYVATFDERIHWHLTSLVLPVF